MMDPEGSHASGTGNDNGSATVAANSIPVADATPVSNISTFTETPVVPVQLIPDQQEDVAVEPQQQQKKGLRRSTVNPTAAAAAAGTEQDEQLAATAAVTAATVAKHGLGRRSNGTTKNTTAVNTDTENANPAIPSTQANRNNASIPDSPAGIWTPSMIHYKTEAVDDSQSLLSMSNPAATVPMLPTTTTNNNNTMESIEAPEASAPLDGEGNTPDMLPGTNNKQKEEADDDKACRLTKTHCWVLGVVILMVVVAGTAFFVARVTAPPTSGTPDGESGTNSDNMQQVPLDGDEQNALTSTDTNTKDEAMNSLSPSSTTFPFTVDATDSPFFIPSIPPSINPSGKLVTASTDFPSALPTMAPTMQSFKKPSMLPTTIPMMLPTTAPSNVPSRNPSEVPTTSPSDSLSNGPTIRVTQMPTTSPTTQESTTHPTPNRASPDPTTQTTILQPVPTLRSTPQPTSVATIPATPIPQMVELFGQNYTVESTARVRRDQAGLTGTIPAEIGFLTRLPQLSLFDNDITGTIPSEIGLMTALTSLGLGSNQITGPIPTEVGLLTAVTWLGLSGNQFSGDIPSEIGLMKSIEYLGLAGSQLGGEIPTEIGLLTQMTRMLLQSNNRLSGSVPTSICVNPNLDIIGVDCHAVTCTCTKCGCLRQRRLKIAKHEKT